jgi:hypothetical protein
MYITQLLYIGLFFTIEMSHIMHVLNRSYFLFVYDYIA